MRALIDGVPCCQACACHVTNPCHKCGRIKATGDRQSDHYSEAKALVAKTQNARVPHLQRKLGIGYVAASKLIDWLEDDGHIGEYRGSKPRVIFLEREDEKI